MHGRSRRWFHPVALQTMSDLARSPRWMRFADHKHPRFDGGIAVIGAAMRPARMIGERPIPGKCTAQPLVADIRTNPEPPAQLSPVCPLLCCKPDKLTPLIHHRHLVPWHGKASLTGSIPSILMCQLCLRTPVSDLSGPNIHAGHPVRRGFSAPSLTPLEYWIALSSRATTRDDAAPLKSTSPPRTSARHGRPAA